MERLTVHMEIEMSNRRAIYDQNKFEKYIFHKRYSLD